MYRYVGHGRWEMVNCGVFSSCFFLALRSPVVCLQLSPTPPLHIIPSSVRPSLRSFLRLARVLSCLVSSRTTVQPTPGPTGGWRTLDPQRISVSDEDNAHSSINSTCMYLEPIICLQAGLLSNNISGCAVLSEVATPPLMYSYSCNSHIHVYRARTTQQ